MSLIKQLRRLRPNEEEEQFANEATVKALHEQVQSVRRTSIYDGETGAYQRWYFELRLREEAERCSRYGLSMIVMTARLRRESYPGEAAWCMATTRAAYALRHTVRSVDLVALLDEGTFGICLVHCDSDSARGVVERLNRQMADVAIDSLAFPSDTASVTELLSHLTR